MSITDKKPNNYRQLNKNLSGLPYIRKLSSGGNIGTNVIPIERIEKFDIQLDATNTDKIYSYNHKLGKKFMAWGRYKRDSSSKWTTLNQEITTTGGGNIGAVTIKNVTKNRIDLYADLTVEFPLLNFEIYFLKIGFDQQKDTNNRNN